MATLAEELIYCPKIRLFRWNEKLVDKKNFLKDSFHGLCLFDIISNNFSITCHPDSRKFAVRKSPNRSYDRVTIFDLDRLLLWSAADDDDDGRDHRDRDNLLELATELVTETFLFSPETAAELGRQIIAHLAEDYQLKGSNKLLASLIGGGPRFVMVVQIRVFRWFEFTGTQPHLPPVFDSLTSCNGVHHHRHHQEEEPEPEPEPEPSSDSADDDSDKDDESKEKWAPDEVRWYDYSDEAAAYWLGLRNYLGEPKHDNLLTRAIIKDEPRGLWEIPPTSLVLHNQTDDYKESQSAEEEETQERGDEFCCYICLNGFELDDLDEFERTICGHVFHRMCIWNWLYRINSCPVCRRNLPLLATDLMTLHIDASDVVC